MSPLDPNEAETETRQERWLRPFVLLRAARQSLVGASFLAVQPLLLNILSLPVIAYIVAELGALGYGQWSASLTLATAAGVLTNLGLRSLFVRSVAQSPDLAPKAFAEHLGLRAALGLCAGALAVVAALLLEYPSIIVQCTLILTIATVSATTATLVSDFLGTQERFQLVAGINLTAGLCLTAASVVVVWLGWGPLGLACAYSLGPLLNACLALVFVHRRFMPVRVSWNLQAYWRWLMDARLLGSQLLVTTGNQHLENLVGPKLLGMSEFGYFSAGALLARRLDIVSDALNTAFYPVLARDWHASPRRGRQTTARLAVLMLIACLPPTVVIYFLAAPIAGILFPDSPDICRRVIEITIWWVPLTGLSYAVSYVLNAAGREREETRLAVWSTGLSLPVSVALIVTFGVIGAAIALVCRATLGLLVRIPAFLRTMRTPHQMVLS